MSVRPFLLGLVAIALLAPMSLHAAAPLPALLDAGADPTACAEPKGPAALPVVADPLGLDERLAALYALYEGLPGFIDVHFRPDAATAFTALFGGRVPEAAHAVETPIPVALEAVPLDLRSAPLAEDPSPTPVGPTAGASLDANDVLCPGIRPGSRIVTNNAVCTLAFLFTDGNKIYASTAGHCLKVGDIPYIDRGGSIGTVVFSTGDGGVGKDFALIEISSSKHHLVDPAMCDYGGPERMNAGQITGSVVLHTGHGAGIVGYVPPRPKQGIGGSWGHTSFAWFGTVVPGDSGSAVETSSGSALGVVTHLGFGRQLGNNFGTRLDTALDSAGYGHLDLMTADMEVL